MQIQECYLEQAGRLHRTCPVVDAHLDLAGELLLHVNNGEREVLRRHYLDELREGGFNLVVSSVYLENQCLPEMGLRTAMDQIGVLLDELDQNEEFLLVKTGRDLDRALEEDRIGVLLYLEGMDFIGTDFRMLRALWEMGVRGASLTWSRRNALASGCCPASRRMPIPGGLTDEGVEAVHRMEELGMFLDVSHLNDAGFYEVSQMSDCPFIASHSDCRALTQSPRNLTDEQLRALAAAGGVAGMNAYGPFCETEAHGRSPETLLAHLSHVVENFGYGHAGIGFDLCDCIESLSAYDGGRRNDLFRDHADAACFIEAVRARYPRAQTSAILGGDFLRVVENVMR